MGRVRTYLDIMKTHPAWFQEVALESVANLLRMFPLPANMSPGLHGELTSKARVAAFDSGARYLRVGGAVETFALVTEPTGAKAEKVTLMIFDLLGRKIYENTWNDVNSFTWDGGDYRTGAYIAVVVVEDSHLDEPFVWRGFVYIKR